MKPENPNPADPSAQGAATQDGAPGLATPEQIVQFADQLMACADALHARIMHDIQAYQGGPVPLKAQETARKLLDDEQVLRQRADGMIADAAALVVHALAKSQLNVLKITADAGEKLKKLTKLYDAMGIVGRLLEITGAVATGNPVFIMRSLEDMHHMLDLIASQSPPPPDPAPAATPAQGAAPGQAAAQARPATAAQPGTPGIPADPGEGTA
jgi:hypothetical protein